jgi:glucokinase
MSNILLCDMGGTHARFARYIKQGEYAGFKKYRLNDFSSFESIIEAYLNETAQSFSNALFSVARTPMNGVIEYSRDDADPDYIINFNIIREQFKWPDMHWFNDLEAAAMGVPCLSNDQTETILKSTGDKWNDHKIIISVGTGVGHAGLMNDQIMRTTGGHWQPITVTEDQRKIEQFIRNRKDKNLSLIMEDFVSGRGLRAIAECISGQSNTHLSPDVFMQDLKNNPEAIRLFFEFLGLYAHNIVSVTGFYGGIYLTGGVIDNLIKHGLTNWDAFETFFRPPMVHGVSHRLNSTSVNYVIHNELPLLGLTTLP